MVSAFSQGPHQKEARKISKNIFSRDLPSRGQSAALCIPMGSHKKLSGGIVRRELASVSPTYSNPWKGRVNIVSVSTMRRQCGGKEWELLSNMMPVMGEGCDDIKNKLNGRRCRSSRRIL
jgi:hypothetical protein